jgi:hypothetical protein
MSTCLSRLCSPSSLPRYHVTLYSTLILLLSPCPLPRSLLCSIRYPCHPLLPSSAPSVPCHPPLTFSNPLSPCHRLLLLHSPCPKASSYPPPPKRPCHPLLPPSPPPSPCATWFPLQCSSCRHSALSFPSLLPCLHVTLSFTPPRSPVAVSPSPPLCFPVAMSPFPPLLSCLPCHPLLHSSLLPCRHVTLSPSAPLSQYHPLLQSSSAPLSPCHPLLLCSPVAVSRPLPPPPPAVGVVYPLPPPHPLPPPLCRFQQSAQL